MNVYVNTDVRLDPDGELLPTDWYTEIHIAATRRSKHLAKQKAQWVIEAETMNTDQKEPTPSHDLTVDDDVTVIASSNDGTPLRIHVEESMDRRKVLQDAYHEDTICAKILAHPGAHLRFSVCEGLIWTKNQLKQDIIYIKRCIPKRKKAGQNHYQPHTPGNWPL